MGAKASQTYEADDAQDKASGKLPPDLAQPSLTTTMQGPDGVIESGLHTPLPVDTVPYDGPKQEYLFTVTNARFGDQGIFETHINELILRKTCFKGHGEIQLHVEFC